MPQLAIWTCCCNLKLPQQGSEHFDLALQGLNLLALAVIEVQRVMTELPTGAPLLTVLADWQVGHRNMGHLR